MLLLAACGGGTQTADTPTPEAKVAAKAIAHPTPTNELPKPEPTKLPAPEPTPTEAPPTATAATQATGVAPTPTATTPSDDAPATPVPPAPSGPGLRIPVQGADHISQSQTHPDYNSVPATSGWHYGDASAPVPWGVHGDALPDEILVHNLEHGGVGIHYNCPEGCAELISQLKKIADRMGKVILSPYPGMETKIALTAWTFLDTFDEFDKDRIEDFARAHESSPNAPEYLVR